MPIIRRGRHLIVASQSIVPEVDEEEEEQTANSLSATFPRTEESPKNIKRKPSLVELVLVSVHHPAASGN